MVQQVRVIITLLMNTNDALRTELYGGVYSELSMNIMNLISVGELFPSAIMIPTKNFCYDVYLNILLMILAGWILWSIL